MNILKNAIAIFSVLSIATALQVLILYILVNNNIDKNVISGITIFTFMGILYVMTKILDNILNHINK
jgi:hypothetical protein